MGFKLLKFTSVVYVLNCQYFYGVVERDGVGDGQWW